MDDREFPEDDPLDRAWDDAVRGRPPRSDPPLDPALADAVRRLHALDDAPAPDRAFVRRLRKEIVAMTATSLPIETTTGMLLPGGAPPTPVPPRRPTAGHLLTAALVAATLVIGYAATAILGPNADRSADVPSAQVGATPADAGQPEIEPLVRTIADRMPTAFSFAGLDLVTLQPGGAEDQFAWSHPRLVVVESGTVGIRADAPVMVGRAGVGFLASETAPTLAAGDAAVIPADLVHAFFNAAGPGDPTPAEPAVIVDALVTDATLSGASGRGVETVVLASVSGGPVPAAPAEVVLGRAHLLPGEALPPPPAGVLQVVGPLPADDGIVRTTGDGSARNTGARPASVFVLTVASLPANGAATPNP